MNGLSRIMFLHKSKQGFVTVFVLFALIILSGLLYFRLEMLSVKNQQNKLLKEKIIREVDEFNSQK